MFSCLLGIILGAKMERMKHPSLEENLKSLRDTYSKGFEDGYILGGHQALTNSRILSVDIAESIFNEVMGLKEDEA